MAAKCKDCGEPAEQWCPSCNRPFCGPDGCCETGSYHPQEQEEGMLLCDASVLEFVQAARRPN